MVACTVASEQVAWATSPVWSCTDTTKDLSASATTDPMGARRDQRTSTISGHTNSALAALPWPHMILKELWCGYSSKRARTIFSAQASATRSTPARVQ